MLSKLRAVAAPRVGDIINGCGVIAVTHSKVLAVPIKRDVAFTLLENAGLPVSHTETYTLRAWRAHHWPCLLPEGLRPSEDQGLAIAAYVIVGWQVTQSICRTYLVVGGVFLVGRGALSCLLEAGQAGTSTALVGLLVLMPILNALWAITNHPTISDTHP